MFWNNEILQHKRNRYRATNLRTGKDHVKTQITESPLLACEKCRVVAMTALCTYSSQMHDSCASIDLSNLYAPVGFVKSYQNRPDIGTISYTNVAYGHEDDDCRGGSDCNVGWDCISFMQVNTSWR